MFLKRKAFGARFATYIRLRYEESSQSFKAKKKKAKIKKLIPRKAFATESTRPKV